MLLSDFELNNDFFFASYCTASRSTWLIRELQKKTPLDSAMERESDVLLQNWTLHSGGFDDFFNNIESRQITLRIVG